MKVSELIEKLRTLPMEAEVYAIDGVPHVPDATAFYPVVSVNMDGDAVKLETDNQAPSL